MKTRVFPFLPFLRHPKFGTSSLESWCSAELMALSYVASQVFVHVGRYEAALDVSLAVSGRASPLRAFHLMVVGLTPLDALLTSSDWEFSLVLGSPS